MWFGSRWHVLNGQELGMDVWLDDQRTARRQNGGLWGALEDNDLINGP